MIAPPGTGRPTTTDPGKQDRARRGLPVLPALDGLRAAAIFAIVLLHLISATVPVNGELARTAFYATLPQAVDALFIISGFVVFLPTVARHGDFGSVRAYALRRGARLLPAFWLSIVVVIALLVLWPLAPKPDLPGVGSIATHLGMVHMPALIFDEDFILGFGINGPLWTLSLEATFYLLLPLIAGIYLRHPLIGLAVAAIVSAGWKYGIVHLDDVYSLLGVDPGPGEVQRMRRAADNQFPAWAFAFAAGMTAAWAYVEVRQRFQDAEIHRPALMGQIAGVLGMALTGYLLSRYFIDTEAILPSTGRRSAVLSLGFTGSMALFMLATTLSPPRLQRPFNLPTARRLGDISYGVYLIHLPFIFFTGALLTPQFGTASAFLLIGAVAVPAAIIYGAVTAHYLEQPIRRWAQRFGRRAQGGTGPLPEPRDGRGGER